MCVIFRPLLSILSSRMLRRSLRQSRSMTQYVAWIHGEPNLMNFGVLISCKNIVNPQVHDTITESEETNPDGR